MPGAAALEQQALTPLRLQGTGTRPVRDSAMGVYVGISYAEYAQAAARAMPAVSTYTATGGALSVAAGGRAASLRAAGSPAAAVLRGRGTAKQNPRQEHTDATCRLHLRAAVCVAGRLSYVFGLSGPSVAVDTACSSSLVAVGQAHNALMLGIVPACLAAGVNLLLSPHTHAMYAVAGEHSLPLAHSWPRSTRH